MEIKPGKFFRKKTPKLESGDGEPTLAPKIAPRFTLRKKNPDIESADKAPTPAFSFQRRKKTPDSESEGTPPASVFSFLRRKNTAEVSEEVAAAPDDGQFGIRDLADESAIRDIADEPPAEITKRRLGRKPDKVEKPEVAKAPPFSGLRRSGKPKEARNTAGKSKGGFATSRGDKYVIFLGDEGAILIYIKGKKVISRQFIPDSQEANLQDFRDTLSQDPKAELFLVIDSMDQVFIQQTLPPVSSLGVGKLIRRRLDRDFGANDIKGALLLSREKTGRKDWNFLMVSVERTPHIGAWLDFIADLPNKFAGIYLLSIEAESIVKHIDKVILPASDLPPSQWKFLVSHNKVGGFRQVILRDGRIIFTRMTQPIGESTPEVIAGNIEQEISGTIEYMKRLGFSAQTGLDIYVVTSNSVRDALDLAKAGARSTHIFTPNETAQFFGIEGAAQPGDQFGDVIMGACVGVAKKHVLALSTPYFKQLASLYQSMALVRLVAILSVLGAVIYMGMLGYDFYTAYDQTDELTNSRRREEVALAAIKEEVGKTNLDIDKISDTLDLYQVMLAEKTTPVPFLKFVATKLSIPVPVKEMSWTLDTGKAAPKKRAVAGVKAVDLPQMTATFTLEFKDTGDEEDLIKAQSEKILQSFKDALPGYTIGYDKPVVSAHDDGNLSISFEAQKQAKVAAEKKVTKEKLITAQLIIKGDVMMPADKSAVGAVAKPAEKTATPAPASAVAPAAQPAVKELP